MSVSHSESSFRESMLSRQSSLSKAKFQQVASISTIGMVSSRACDTSCTVDSEPVFRNACRFRTSASFFGLKFIPGLQLQLKPKGPI